MKLLSGSNYDIREILLILIEVAYTALLSILGSRFFKELKEELKFDSLTIAGIIILAIASIFSYNSYINTLTTTLGSLALVGFNIKKLDKSLTLKIFLVLRLILAYIEIVLLSHISFGDGILILPLLTWAIVQNIGYLRITSLEIYQN